MEWTEFSVTVQQHQDTFRLRAYQGLPTDEAEPLAEETQTWPDSRQLLAALREFRLDGPCDDALAGLGMCAAAWLLPGSIGEAFFERVACIGQDAQKRLRLRLCFDQAFLDKPSPEFAHFYWEALCIADWQAELEQARQTYRRPHLPLRIYHPFVALNESISIVRQVLGVTMTLSPAVAEPLRLVVVHCNARQQPIERLDDMLSALWQAIEPLRTEQLVACPDEWRLRDPTPQQVLDTITQVNPHVLVTMCHGDRRRFGTQIDGLFLLSDGHGGEENLAAQKIARTLQSMPEPQLRVVFMPPCHTMAAAPALLAAGVPAVVGMQELIADHLITVHLVDEFFRSLAAFKSLDECLLDVRERLSGGFTNGNPHWCFPTLWLAASDSRVFAPLAEVRKGQYLREVLRTHARMRLFGHQEAVPLAQHYVDAGTQREVEKRSPADADNYRATRDQPIADWLSAHERVMRTFEDVNVFEALKDDRSRPAQKRYYIAGSPGAGKTTMLKQFTVRFAEEALKEEGRIPVFIELHALEEWLQDHLSDPHAALLTFVTQKLQPIPDPQKLLARGDVILCFDGLDEVLEKVPHARRDLPLRDLICQSLTWCADTFPQCPMLITSRLRACPQALSGFTTVEMKSFDEPRMHAYAEAYFRHVPSASAASATDAAVEARRFMDALKRNTHLNALAGTPLLLSLICYLYRLEGLPLPAGQSQLYDRATLYLLQANLRRAARVYPDVLKRRILEMIAFEVTVRHHRLTAFRYEQFNQAALQVLKAVEVEFGQADLHTVLEDIVGNSGLLQRVADGRYAFLHLSFMEYFAAAGAETAQQTLLIAPEVFWSFIDKKGWDPDWEPFILFLAGKLTDPSPLLKLLSDEKRDDYYRHRLALAALCLPEIPSDIRSVQAHFVDAITTATFSLWWHYTINDINSTLLHLDRALPAVANMNGRLLAIAQDNEPYHLYLRQETSILGYISQQLFNTNSHARRVAVDAVGKLGHVAVTPDILAQLAILLQDQHGRVRWAAVDAVGRLGHVAASPAFLAQLATLLQNQDGEVRWAAVDAVMCGFLR